MPILRSDLNDFLEIGIMPEHTGKLGERMWLGRHFQRHDFGTFAERVLQRLLELGQSLLE
jgi:hypothetical protein